MDKAYIVANEDQEREVLEDLYKRGKRWTISGKDKSAAEKFGLKFPYVIYEFLSDIFLKYGAVENIGSDSEIVYDGRKENKMKISKEVYDALVEWRRYQNLTNSFVGHTDIEKFPEVVKEWWIEDFTDILKANNRLIAIIRWVNGEDVFEIEKPKKWVVRSKETDEDGYCRYVFTMHYGMQGNAYSKNNATKFDTKSEAESWANAHQEVVKVDG